MRVLIAEDEALARRTLERALISWGYEPVVARDGEEAWAILEKADAPRLAVLDWLMPGMDGIDICTKLRTRKNGAPYTYVILLTGKDSKEDILAGLSAGADDYICKPFDSKELEVRIRAGRRIVELQSELISAREALRTQATTDALTSVLNRRAVMDRFAEETTRAVRTADHVGVVLVDVDHFKAVNDGFGHAAGDHVLRTVARVMVNSLRAYDAVGRYGGEEFLLILPGCDLQQTAAAAERVRQQIAAAPMSYGDGEIPVTVSLGALSVQCNHPRDVEALVNAADKALYRAKRSGRNRVEIARVTDARRSIEPFAIVALEH